MVKKILRASLILVVISLISQPLSFNKWIKQASGSSDPDWEYFREEARIAKAQEYAGAAEYSRSLTRRLDSDLSPVRKFAPGVDPYDSDDELYGCNRLEKDSSGRGKEVPYDLDPFSEEAFKLSKACCRLHNLPITKKITVALQAWVKAEFEERSRYYVAHTDELKALADSAIGMALRIGNIAEKQEKARKLVDKMTAWAREGHGKLKEELTYMAEGISRPNTNYCY